MVNNSTARNYGIIGTVVFHAIILALLLCVYLAYPSSDKLLEKQQEEKPMEVLLGGEYVMIGQFPDATIPGEPADEASPQVDDNMATPPEAITTQVTESPAQVPASTAPQQQLSNQAANNISNMSNAFASNSQNSNANADGQNAGTPNGNATTGSVSLNLGAGGNGRGFINSITIRGDIPEGTIIVSVKVTPTGEVIPIEISGGTSPARSNPTWRKYFLDQARRLKVKPDPNATGDVYGTITFR